MGDRAPSRSHFSRRPRSIALTFNIFALHCRRVLYKGCLNRAIFRAGPAFISLRSPLGILVAGIAHEINNPVNFIYGNITYVNDYAGDILKLLAMYQDRYPEADTEIEVFLEKIDIDFLREDLLKTLSSMKVGSDRIREIVLTLRNLAR
ncbi:histidine kinase dimerization/phospho-acceptor domain-containing protein [Microcoleus sp. LAD1_D3]|uniref:hypothetical protein n=1 Tax=Microcoleus sp. LAD1_D3 TaxID=2819365 RepID=UPI002FD77EE0